MKAMLQGDDFGRGEKRTMGSPKLIGESLDDMEER